MLFHCQTSGWVVALFHCQASGWVVALFHCQASGWVVALFHCQASGWVVVLFHCQALGWVVVSYWELQLDEPGVCHHSLDIHGLIRFAQLAAVNCGQSGRETPLVAADDLPVNINEQNAVSIQSRIITHHCIVVLLANVRECVVTYQCK